MPRASAFGGRGHIPLPHLPQTGHAAPLRNFSSYGPFAEIWDVDSGNTGYRSLLLVLFTLGAHTPKGLW
jgi:hypothetical protein